MKVLKLRLERLKIIKENQQDAAKKEEENRKNEQIAVNSQFLNTFMTQNHLINRSTFSQNVDECYDLIGLNRTLQVEKQNDFKTFNYLHEQLAKLKAKENEILRNYLERKIVIYFKRRSIFSSSSTSSSYSSLIQFQNKKKKKLRPNESIDRARTSTTKKRRIKIKQRPKVFKKS